MEIEEVIKRVSYRDFGMVQLRHGFATETRWHITQVESGMGRNYGFASSEHAAREKIDDLLKRRAEGRDTRLPC